MEAKAIEKIEQLVKYGIITTVDDVTYSPVELYPVLYNPRPSVETVRTLKGFCDFIKEDIDGIIAGNAWLIMVRSPTQVDLISDTGGTDKGRIVLISAEVDPGLKTFPFEKFLEQEDFNIKIRSLFTPKEEDDFTYVLLYASKLSGGTTIDTEDDGITQKVGIKQGISGALVKKENMKPIVKLSPYRTFREVSQPESDFLFRVRLTADNIPTVALFEADGGIWINEAMSNIAEYIRENVKDIPVIT